MSRAEGDFNHKRTKGGSGGLGRKSRRKGGGERFLLLGFEIEERPRLFGGGTGNTRGVSLMAAGGVGIRDFAGGSRSSINRVHD